MVLNYPGPYELRVYYTCDASPGGALQHQARFSLNLAADPDVGDDFSTIAVALRGGGTDTLDDVTDGLRNVLEDLLSAADTTIDYAELWKYVQGTFQATYVSTYAIAAAATDAGGARAAAESIWTFRTSHGGIFKCTLLDHIGSPSPPAVYADMDADNQALCDFFTHPTLAAFVGRDGGWPVVPIAVYIGQNEHVFKKRYGR